jgi:hypothetical protein
VTKVDIKHFLVIYDIPKGVARIEAFDTDYAAALSAYEKAEEEHRDNPDVEVVLLGSDSRATIERTHSSYFDLSETHIDRLVARDLAELGLR